MADIQLSSQLFQDIQGAVERQHPGADAGTSMQYLVAVAAYMLANQSSMSSEQQDAYLDDLHAFAKHVVSDVRSRQQATTPPPSQEAFGIWEP